MILLLVLFTVIWSIFAYIGVYTVLYNFYGGSNCYLSYIQCVDLTHTKKLPSSVCFNGYNCNQYCKKTYGKGIDWVSKCVTDGNSSDCINFQACACEVE